MASPRRGVVLAGASTYNLANVSDDAMFEPLYRALRQGLGEEPISLLCRHPEVRSVGDGHLRLVHNLDFPTKALSQGKRFRGFNPGDPQDHLTEMARLIGGARALIIGGDPFIEITLGSFRGILPYTQMLITLARFLGTPVVLFGVHLGRPPTSEFGVDLMQFCLENASLITTREESVVPRLRALVPDARILAGADAGFSVDLDLAPSDAARAFRARLAGAARPAPEAPGAYALATLRSMYWLWRAPERAAFAETCARVLDEAFAARGTPVVLAPHCTYDVDHPWEDDRAMHRLIRSHSAFGDRMVLYEGEARVGDVLHLQRGAGFVVSNRRHAGIFAALLEKPFVIFGEPGHIRPIHDVLLDNGASASPDFLDYEALTAEGLLRAIGNGQGVAGPGPGDAQGAAAGSTAGAGRHPDRITPKQTAHRARQEREKSGRCLEAMVTFVREQRHD